MILGNKINKHYYLDKRIKVGSSVIKDIVIEYNQEQLSGSILNNDDDEELYTFDLEFFDDIIDYDIVMDKKIFKDYLDVKQLSIDKECDDYPELI